MELRKRHAEEWKQRVHTWGGSSHDTVLVQEEMNKDEKKDKKQDKKTDEKKKSLFARVMGALGFTELYIVVKDINLCSTATKDATTLLSPFMSLT